MRLYQNYGIHILETLFEENPGNRIILKRLAMELGQRQTARAQILRGRVTERLCELESAKSTVAQPAPAELAGLVSRLESAIELQRALRDGDLDGEAARLEDLLREQLARLRRVAPATPPRPAVETRAEPDVADLVERAVELIRQRGPLFFIQLRTELLRGPGQAAREVPLRLALRLDPRVSDNDRDRWSLTTEAVTTPATSSASVEQQVIQRLRENKKPLFQQSFSDLPEAELTKAVTDSRRLVWAFAPAVRVLMLSEWGIDGYEQAARMGWEIIRGCLLTGARLTFTRHEWTAIRRVADARQDLPMLSRANHFFQL